MACRVLRIVFALVYLAAVALLFLASFGWIGTGGDPQAGVFLMVLGVPWSLIPYALADGRTFAAVNIVAPLINYAILTWLCRRSPQGYPGGN